MSLLSSNSSKLTNSTPSACFRNDYTQGLSFQMPEQFLQPHFRYFQILQYLLFFLQARLADIQTAKKFCSFSIDRRQQILHIHAPCCNAPKINAKVCCATAFVEYEPALQTVIPCFLQYSISMLLYPVAKVRYILNSLQVLMNPRQVGFCCR